MAAFNDRKDSRRLALAWLMLTFYWSLHREWQHVCVIILNSFTVLRPAFPKKWPKKRKLVQLVWKFFQGVFSKFRKKERKEKNSWKLSSRYIIYFIKCLHKCERKPRVYLRYLMLCYYDSKRFYISFGVLSFLSFVCLL